MTQNLFSFLLLITPMHALNRFLAFTLLIFPVTSLPCLNAQDFVTLRSLQGVSIRAVIEKVEQGHVVLRREDGIRFNSPLSLFDLNSRAYLLRERQRLLSLPRTTSIVPASPSALESGVSSQKSDSFESSPKEFRALNEIIGQPLFVDGSLWDDDPVAVGTRLRWPRESITSSQTSYRLYPPSNYRFVGARPYSAALYGDASKVTGLSLVFANKGDCFAAAGAAEEHFKDGTVTKDPRQLKKWMEHDADLVAELFENLLGKPRRQNFGQGSAKRKVSRWDWNGHSFLLSVMDGEFVSLSVETVASAEARGKTRKTADMYIRRIHRENVDRRPNGDVVIQNLPMVDQGPKGYCVPATFERCMRYMAIPADMYLLAMAGNTGLGGGTHTPTLVQAVQQEVVSAGRNFKPLRGHPSLRELARSIDSGVPILWGLHSTKTFNRIANDRTVDRKGMDAREWKSLMSKAVKEAGDLAEPGSGDSNHICIIHGYNKETEEIAFTDSWGERYQERWITAAEAAHFSQGRCWVIEY